MIHGGSGALLELIILKYIYLNFLVLFCQSRWHLNHLIHFTLSSGLEKVNPSGGNWQPCNIEVGGGGGGGVKRMIYFAHYFGLTDEQIIMVLI